MSCSEKIKLTCSGKQFATCVKYEGALPEWSGLDQCADIKETTSEIYETLTDVKNSIDFTEIDLNCLNIPLVTPKSLIQAMINKICALEQRVINLEETVATQQEEIQDLQQQNCP